MPACNDDGSDDIEDILTKEDVLKEAEEPEKNNEQQAEEGVPSNKESAKRKLRQAMQKSTLASTRLTKETTNWPRKS